ncbi:NLRC3 [Branchiostoma lanceolatum]|uniref:NLRC3 protein n=1 Tax=Branchiostoma lanceolatum TaxID=7740 RepID=A0A8J9YY71_BRALA|nr:NLRC3 [Branchiostoma lanceolatum]
MNTKPMSLRHRDVLRESRTSIMDSLDAKHVVDHLYQDGVLTDTTKGDITAIHEEKRRERVAKLLDILPVSPIGDRAFENFCLALEKCEYAFLAEMLREAEKRVQSHTVTTGAVPDVVDKCEKALKDHYKSTYQKHYPLSWHAFRLETEKVYIKNQFSRVDRSDTDEIDSTPEDKLQFDKKNLLLQGRPGVGKTTLIYHQAYTWAAGKNPALKDIKLLFALSARTVRTGNLLQAVCDQLLESDFLSSAEVERLEGWIKENPRRTMFMIENVDETPGVSENDVADPDHTKHPILRYLLKKYLRETPSILTSRSTEVTTGNSSPKALHIPLYCDAHYNVNGFSPGDVDRYIDQFFKCRKDGEKDAKSLKWAISVDDCLHDIVRNPFYAVIISILWGSRIRKPNTCTEIVEEVIALVARRYVEDPKHSMTKEKMEECLGNLAKLAWDSIATDKFDFTSKEVKEAIGNDSVIHMGLIVEDPTIREVRYKFQHKTFKELLAAKYAVTRPPDTEERKQCLRKLWSTECVSGQNYVNVCLFAAGLLRENCQDLFEAFDVNFSEMTRLEAPKCCVHDDTSRACWAVSESGHVKKTALLLAAFLPETIELDFKRRPPKPAVIRGLAEVMEALSTDKKVEIAEMWVLNPKSLQRLGRAMKCTRRVKYLKVNVTGLDMTLSNPMEEDNSGIIHFHQGLAENQSILHLTIEANIDRMDEFAVKTIPQAIQENKSIRDLHLQVYCAKSCPHRCSNKISKGFKTHCSRERNAEVFIDSLSTALRLNSTLQSLYLSGYILRHKKALELLAPAIAGHQRLRAIHVKGFSGGRGHIQDPGIEALAYVMKNTKTLTSLSIQLNGLTSVDATTESANCAIKLCEALKKCRTLERLELVFTWMFAREKLLFAEVISASQNIKEVILVWRNMNKSFLFALCKAIEEQCSGSLRKVELAGRFNAEGLGELGRIVSTSETLQDVELHGKPFCREGFQAFVDKVNESQTRFTPCRAKPIKVTMNGTVEGRLTETLAFQSVQVNLSAHLQPAEPDPLMYIPVGLEGLL